MALPVAGIGALLGGGGAGGGGGSIPGLGFSTSQAVSTSVQTMFGDKTLVLARNASATVNKTTSQDQTQTPTASSSAAGQGSARSDAMGSADAAPAPAAATNLTPIAIAAGVIGLAFAAVLLVSKK